MSYINEEGSEERIFFKKKTRRILKSARIVQKLRKKQFQWGSERERERLSKKSANAKAFDGGAGYEGNVRKAAFAENAKNFLADTSVDMRPSPTGASTNPATQPRRSGAPTRNARGRCCDADADLRTHRTAASLGSGREDHPALQRSDH